MREPKYNVDEIRTRHLRAYERWEPSEDTALLEQHRGGQTPERIAQLLGRQPSAVIRRIEKLAARLLLPVPEAFARGY